MGLKGPHKNQPFVELSEQIAGAWVKMAEVSCCRCGALESIKITRSGVLLAPPYIIKRFTELGWSIGRNQKQNVCGKCQFARKPSQPALTIVQDTKHEDDMGKVEPLIKPDAPRAMGREDRRIVFEKLNEVYLDEKRGYDSGWSDQKVATDLGVPRSWVENVREEMFGSVSSNPEMEEFMRAVADLNEIKVTLASVATLRNQMNNIQAVLGGINVPVMSSRVDKLEKLANELKKHTST